MKLKILIKDTELQNFMKIFKIQKDKISISLLEKIFKPNLATKYILTNQILLNSFSSIDLNCLDLIISGNPNPRIICLEKSTLDILDENSKLWPILFDMFNKDIKVTDLVSAIRAIYNLNILKI